MQRTLIYNTVHGISKPKTSLKRNDMLPVSLALCKGNLKFNRFYKRYKNRRDRGPTNLQAVRRLTPNLVKLRSREIGCYNDCIALTFFRHLGSAAADVPVIFQSDWKSLKPNLAASRLREILRYRLVNICQIGVSWMATKALIQYKDDILPV